MQYVLALLALTLLPSQDDGARQAQAKQFIGKLGSDAIEERDRAYEALKQIGSVALPALRQAKAGQNLEARELITRLLRVIPVSDQLTAALKAAFSGIEEKLALGPPGEWTRLFLVIARKPRAYPTVGKADLSVLAGPALACASKDPDKHEIAQAIGWYGLRAALPEVIRLLEDKDGYRRGDAAWVIGVLGAREEMPKLMDLLWDDHPEPRRKAIFALARMKVKEAVPRIGHRLTDRDANVRNAAIWALSALGATEYIPQITELIRVPDGSGYWYAIRALARLGPERAHPRILRMLGSEEAVVRRHALGAVRELQIRQATPVVLGLLEDPSDGVRAAAINTLADLGDERLVPMIARLLEDESHHVRREAIWAAWKLDVRGEIPRLLARFEDDSVYIQAVTADVMELFRDPRAVPGLLRLLDHPKDFVREDAVEALGTIRATSSAPRLITLLADPEEFVRIKVGEALTRMGRPEGAEHLLATEQGDLESLNAFRRPSLWDALSDITFQGPLRGTRRELLKGLATRIGMKLAIPSPLSFKELPWFERYLTFRNRRDRLTAQDLIGFLTGGPFEAVLDDGRIRLLPRDEALVFWRNWWKAQEEK